MDTHLLDCALQKTLPLRATRLSGSPIHPGFRKCHVGLAHPASTQQASAAIGSRQVKHTEPGQGLASVACRLSSSELSCTAVSSAETYRKVHAMTPTAPSERQSLSLVPFQRPVGELPSSNLMREVSCIATSSSLVLRTLPDISVPQDLRSSAVQTDQALQEDRTCSREVSARDIACADSAQLSVIHTCAVM